MKTNMYMMTHNTQWGMFKAELRVGKLKTWHFPQT